MDVESTSRQIAEMVKVDQDLRFKARREMAKRGTDEIGIYNYLIYAIDQTHNARIKNILKIHGYPSSKTIGNDMMDAFWLLIQHQDYDSDLQKACLRHCGFSKIHAAFLKDRILVGQGKKQIYGTQFTGRFDNKGNPIPKPVKDIKKLDKIRKAVGLEPFARYIQKIKRMNQKSDRL